MMDKCDMCGIKIENGKCSCGTWKDDLTEHPIKKAIDHFHEMKRFTLTGDAPFLGAAVVFFRGDYNDTKKVQKFIYEMKGRPNYEE